MSVNAQDIDFLREFIQYTTKKENLSTKEINKSNNNNGSKNITHNCDVIPESSTARSSIDEDVEKIFVNKDVKISCNQKQFTDVDAKTKTKFEPKLGVLKACAKDIFANIDTDSNTGDIYWCYGVKGQSVNVIYCGCEITTKQKPIKPVTPVIRTPKSPSSQTIPPTR